MMMTPHRLQTELDVVKVLPDQALTEGASRVVGQSYAIAVH